MASQITDQDHMMSVREVPWHKLGTVLSDHPATSAEAIKAAKLDWRVYLDRVQTPDGVVIPDSFATIRNDSEHGKIPLGVVGKRYSVLQNDEAFEFFDNITKDGLADYETAGSLRQGRKVWILAKLKNDVLVGENDPVAKYVLLSNSHDGSSAINVKVTPVRVVCNNTLSAALQMKDFSKRNEFSFRHTRSAKEKLEQASKTLETVSEAYDKLSKVWSKMAEIKLPKFEQYKFIQHVFPSNSDTKNSKQLETLRAEVAQLLESGTGQDLDSASGTLWGAFNSVTEFQTHNIRTRKGSTLDTHVDNLWYGRTGDVLDRAFNLSLDIMQEKGVDIATL